MNPNSLRVRVSKATYGPTKGWPIFPRHRAHHHDAALWPGIQRLGAQKRRERARDCVHADQIDFELAANIRRVDSSSGPGTATPALLTRPNRFRAASLSCTTAAAARTACSSVTSNNNGMTRSPKLFRETFEVRLPAHAGESPARLRLRPWRQSRGRSRSRRRLRQRRARSRAGSFETVGDAPLRQIVGRHFHEHFIASEH